MNRLSGPAETSDLPKSVHQQFNMYAIAEGTAKVGLMGAGACHFSLSRLAEQGPVNPAAERSADQRGHPKQP